MSDLHPDRGPVDGASATPVGTELDRMRRENAGLDEQVKLLVRTEQRLYRARRALDAELARIDALGDFALRCSRLENPTEILERATHLLLNDFDLQLAIAGHVQPEIGTFRVVSAQESAEAGCESQTLYCDVDLAALGISENRAQGIVSHVPGSASFERARRVVASLATDGPLGDVQSLVSIPLHRANGALLGFVAACKLGSSSSYHQLRVGPAHGPYLQLFANHLERAVQGAVLTSDLRQRGEQLAEANRELQNSVERLERAQEQLVQAQKMEAIGRLAGGIAHDFNNLLTVILSHADLVKRSLPGGSQQRSDVENIVQAAERATEIASHLLAFSRKQERRPESLDLNALAHDTARMLGRLIGEQVVVEIHADASIHCIHADRAQLEQILLNLVLNARDAMPHGGRIDISTRQGTARDADPARTDIDPSQCVVLEVSDTGHGMDAETQAQAFEPFFTTKEVGRGTGMGLATVYGLVAQNGGHIVVRSEVGHGTSFRVLFPAYEGMECVAFAAREPAAARVARALILLAEDEATIRRVAARILRKAGFEVLEAADGKEALRVAASAEAQVDLLVTDVVMPNLAGVALATQLRALQPNLRVLYMSGYTFDSLAVAHLSGTCEHYIRKPFTPRALLENVNRALAQVADADEPRRSGDTALEQPHG